MKTSDAVLYLHIREFYLKISHLYKSPVDWSPSVGFWLLPLYDIALDRISSVILWRFPANNDVIPVLLNTLRHAGWERLIYGGKIKCYSKLSPNNSICLKLKPCIAKHKNLINGKYFKKLPNGFLAVTGESVSRKSDSPLSLRAATLK